MCVSFPLCLSWWRSSVSFFFLLEMVFHVCQVWFYYYPSKLLLQIPSQIQYFSLFLSFFFVHVFTFVHFKTALIALFDFSFNDFNFYFASIHSRKFSKIMKMSTFPMQAYSNKISVKWMLQNESRERMEKRKMKTKTILRSTFEILFDWRITKLFVFNKKKK